MGNISFLVSMATNKHKVQIKPVSLILCASLITLSIIPNIQGEFEAFIDQLYEYIEEFRELGKKLNKLMDNC